MYDILMILVDFCGNFPWFWLIFCYPDPFHETPDLQHWFQQRPLYFLSLLKVWYQGYDSPITDENQLYEYLNDYSEWESSYLSDKLAGYIYILT